MIAVINMCGLLIGGAGGDAHWSQTYFFPKPTLIKAVTRVSTTQGYLIFIGGTWLNCCSSCMFFVFVCFFVFELKSASVDVLGFLSLKYRQRRIE